jgi:hypothetical protein
MGRNNLNKHHQTIIKQNNQLNKYNTNTERNNLKRKKKAVGEK